MRTLTPDEATSIITKADRTYGEDDCNEHYIYASIHRPMSMADFPLLPKGTTRCLNNTIHPNLHQVYTWIVTSQALLDSTIKNYELDVVWWPDLALSTGLRDYAFATLIQAIIDAPGVLRVQATSTNTSTRTRFRVFMFDNQTFTVTIE